MANKNLPIVNATSGLKGRLATALMPHPSDNAWLDLLRTLAILLVFFRHGQRVVHAGPDLNRLETLFINGWAGVDLFLVLSGYLVTKVLARQFTEHGRINLTGYAKRRIRRVVPAYFFVLFLVVVGYFPFFQVSTDNLATRIGYHILFLQDYFPSDINVVFWSLGVEAKFYALVPLLALPVLRLKSWASIFAVGLAVAAISPLVRGVVFVTVDATEYYTFWNQLRSPFYACLEPLMFGFLIAIFESRGFLRLSAQKGCYLFAISLAALFLFLSRQEFLAEINLWDAAGQPIVLSLLFASLLVAAISMKEVHLPLNAAFRFGARISYSLYLVHFPLIPVSSIISKNIGLGAAGFWLVFVSLSLVHSLIILSYIEFPFMRPKSGREMTITSRR
ncbi:MAG: peptidoglycan/LPS O-acetylase OafA/YrhL [Gammaproteobacteria bacterium]